MADTLTTALRIMARDIDCEDGVATTVILQAADEIERLRLTDAEREAVERASAWLVAELWADSDQAVADAATLLALLERTK